MADRETIIETGGDGGSSVILAVILIAVLAVGAYFLFFNRPASAPAGSSVTIEAPTINIPAPEAAPASK